MLHSSGTGQVTFQEGSFNSVKVFSATMVADRERLGGKITDWIANNPRVELRDIVVTQSSDEAFHCIALTVFYWDPENEQS
jgi:hypothetical protein